MRRSRSTPRVAALAASLLSMFAGACGSSPKPGPSDAGDAASPDGATDAPPEAAPDSASLRPPVQLAASPGCGAARLALTGTTLYWTERATGVVKSLSTTLSTTTTGVAPTTVAATQLLAGPIATDDKNVYWATGDKAIMKASLAGGAATPLLTAPDVVTTLLVNAGTLYFGAGAATFSVPRAGGTPATLMTFPTCRTSTPEALAVDATYVYETDFLHEFLSRGRLDGQQMIADACAADPATAPKVAAPETITHTQGELLMDTLTLAANQLIWADGANVIGAPLGAAASQLGQPLAFSAASNPVTGFVVSGTTLYLGESSSTSAAAGDNAIEVAPFAPGDAGVSATVLATGQRGASQLVVDATALYWVTKTPPTTVGGLDVASTPTCVPDAYGVCCDAVCAPNDCAIMMLPR